MSRRNDGQQNAAKMKLQCTKPAILKVEQIYNKIDLEGIENIGYYSLQRSGVGVVKTQKYSEDTSELKYLYDPPSPFCFDLMDGYIDKDWEPSGEGLTYFLHWIVNNRRKVALSSETTPCKSLNTDFICYRGLLSMFMNTPYEKNADWCIHAVKLNGTIYMIDQSTERKAREVANKSEESRKSSFAGRRFEEYICDVEPNRPPNNHLNDGLNHNQFCVVFRSRLNSHSLVYAAECDCIKPGGNPTKLDFIEVKTMKEFKTTWEQEKFRRFKTKTWWIQSYLVGIETIVCGFRNENFEVKKIEEYSANRLRGMGTGYWSKNCCFNFLDSFLNFVKECVTEEGPNVTYEFKWSPETKQVTWKQLNVECKVIPKWYMDKFQ